MMMNNRYINPALLDVMLMGGGGPGGPMMPGYGRGAPPMPMARKLHPKSRHFITLSQLAMGPEKTSTVHATPLALSDLSVTLAVYQYPLACS